MNPGSRMSTGLTPVGQRMRSGRRRQPPHESTPLLFRNGFEPEPNVNLSIPAEGGRARALAGKEVAQHPKGGVGREPPVGVVGDRTEPTTSGNQSSAPITSVSAGDATAHQPNPTPWPWNVRPEVAGARPIRTW